MSQENVLSILRNDHRLIDRETLFDAMSAAVYTTDRNGVITYFNPAAAALWGAEPVLGSSLWCGSFKMSLPGGAPLAHEDCPMAICLKTGEAITNREIIVERPDGARKNVLVSPQPIRDAAGQIIGAINTLSDITDLRAIERARANSVLLTESLLRNSKDCIKLLDLDGRLQSINPCGCTSLELDSPDQAVGKNYFDFWQGADHTAARAAANSALATGSGRFTADFTNKSGKRTTWDEMLSLVTDADGTATGFLVISRDMTRELQDARDKTRQLTQQKALADIGTFGLAQIGFQEFMDRTVALVAQALDVPLAKILRYGDQADHLMLAAGVGWKDGLVRRARVGVERESQAGFTLLHDGPVIVKDLQTETRFYGPALLHEHGVRSGMSVTIPGVSDRPFGVIGIHTTCLRRFNESDANFLVSVANLIASCHRQHEATSRQTLLVREIAHRSGNMLQFVSSIFNQTVRASENLVEAKAKFEVRLAQMSKSNLLISRDGWTKSNVRTLIAQTLEPFSARVELKGRDIMLPAELSFDLGLVLHELATNSCKYGAFSGDTGLVSLTWTVEAGDGKPEFVLTWRDHKQQTHHPNSGSGFGSKLINQLIVSKWSGAVATEVDPQFVCRISFPLPTS